jgi:hypothetical protein
VYSDQIGANSDTKIYLVAISSNDGYLRIFDLNSLAILFIFKTEIGGINSFYLYENYLSMACQNDNIITLNT